MLDLASFFITNRRTFLTCNTTTYKSMDFGFTPIRGLGFYSYGNTHCWADLLHCKKFDKVYVRLSKQSTYTKDGEEQNKTNFVLYTVPASEALLAVLGELIKNAKQFKGVR